MGSQVNFFMVPEDEEAFCEFVLSDPAVAILRACHAERPHVRVAPPLPRADLPWCAGLVLWNSGIAGREQITPSSKVRAQGSLEGVYAIDAILYPVIDFNRSIPLANGLAPGRIWAGFEEWHHLPKERMELYHSWFRRLARWLNKWPYRWDIFRIGPRTKEYLDNGGRFVTFVPGRTTSIREVGTDRVIEYAVQEEIVQPEIVQDDGESDLTFEM